MSSDPREVPVHSTEELSDALGEEVVDRRQLHVWPLSSVELIRTGTGERWVYKSQLEPSVEYEFYRAVTSPLIPNWRPLARTDEWSAMFFEFIDRPVLRDLDLTDRQLADHARAAVCAIGDLPQDVPTYADLGSVPRWDDFVEGVLSLLETLIATRKFEFEITASTYDEVRTWSRTPSVQRMINETSGVVHGDLNPGNVFVDGNHHVIIDWQRPLVGPRDLDVVACLEGRPTMFDHTAPSAVGAFAMVRLHWAVMATTHYLPDLRVVLSIWASQALDLIRRVAQLDR